MNAITDPLLSSPGASLEAEAVNRVKLGFAARYGKAPGVIVRAPGRVNLIGEHTDYNGGHVLPFATEAALIFGAARNGGRNLRVYSASMAEEFTVSLDGSVPRGAPSWSNYLRGVAAGFQQRGITLPGLDVYLDATLPLGGGLSSSAALEVGFATVLEQLTGQNLGLETKALLCQKAEHDYAGMPCGIMDQFAVTFCQRGSLILLDCQTRKMEAVPMASASVSLLVVNSMVKHALSESQYAVRRQHCHEAAEILKVNTLCELSPEQLAAAEGKLTSLLFRRAKHVVHENARTLTAVQALRLGEWSKLGQLMYESHASLRDDYEVSCSELDTLVAIASVIGIAGGVYGCRMTGGGFGGCVVALVKSDRVADVATQIREHYHSQTGHNAALLITRPADGVTVLSSEKP